MKKVLLPTDLTVQSLWAARQMIKEPRHNGALTICIVHMIEIPSSINDLFSLGRNRKYPTTSASFIDALQILRGKAAESNIKIQFDYIYGNNYRVLRNFMQGHDITEVLLLNGYEYSFSQDVSVDFIPFFKKAKTPVRHMPFSTGNFSEFQLLSILLNNETANEAEEVEMYGTAIAV